MYLVVFVLCVWWKKRDENLAFLQEEQLNNSLNEISSNRFSNQSQNNNLNNKEELK